MDPSIYRRYAAKKKYYPLWYLFNGHLQSMARVLLNGVAKTPAIKYQRQLLDMPDGGVASLDWALPPRLEDGSIPTIDEIDPLRKTVLIVAGGAGGGKELYIRTAIEQLLELGWQAVVLNGRGCARTPLRTPQLFSCGYTDDVRNTVRFLTTRYNFAHEAFIALGFCSGSNYLVKYLGEEKERAGFTAAISVSNPYDMLALTNNFSKTWLNRKVYEQGLLWSFKQIFFKSSNALELFKDSPGIDLEAIKSSKTVREFESRLSRVTFNYPTVDDYYSDSSCITRLQDVKIPLLCVNATDDPFAGVLPSPAQMQANPNLIFCLTQSGGHLSFFEGAFDPDAASDSSHQSQMKGVESHSQDSSANKRSSSSLKMWSNKVIAEFAESVLALQKERQLVDAIDALHAQQTAGAHAAKL